MRRRALMTHVNVGAQARAHVAAYTSSYTYICCRAVRHRVTEETGQQLLVKLKPYYEITTQTSIKLPPRDNVNLDNCKVTGNIEYASGEHAYVYWNAEWIEQPVFSCKHLGPAAEVSNGIIDFETYSILLARASPIAMPYRPSSLSAGWASTNYI